MTMPLDETDPREEIGRLETRIEELAETRERCRRFMVLARIAFFAGAAWLLVMALGLVKFTALGLVLGIIGTLGGIVVRGTNASTAVQLTTHIAAAEDRRAALIANLKLNMVSELAEP